MSKANTGFYLKWLDYHVLLRLCGLLPTPLAYAAGRLRARYRCRVRHDTREATRRHMRQFLPELSESDLERYVVEFFYSPCLDELETYFLPRLTLAKLENFMSIEGRENLDSGFSQGRGVIVFSNHSAGVALYLVAFGLMGYKLNVVGRPLDDKENPLHPVVRSYARRRVAWIEKHLGCSFIAPARGSLSMLADRLRNNELVLTLLDVPPEIVRNRVVVKFFGRDCFFPSGFARLAQETGCAMVPCQKFYQPNWAHQKLIFRKPIYASGNLEVDVQNCVSVLEEMIRQHPSQWYVWDNLPMLWAPISQSHGNSPQPAA